MAYQKRKTALKAVTPAVIVPISIAVGYVSKKIGFDIGQDRSYEVAIAIYGVFGGIVNWFKHRRNNRNG